MVNRVLIRLKVVQLLYSYLLSKSEFKVEMPLETSSPDRRYAYVAYAELLLLILEMSGVNVTKRFNRQGIGEAITSARFYNTKFAQTLSLNPDVRALIDTYAARMAGFDPVLAELAAKLRALPAYRTFVKVKAKDATPSDEIDFWVAGLRMMSKQPELIDAMRADEDFTTRGFEMAVKMLIATLHTYSDSRNLLVNCKKDLRRSLDEAYSLYHWLLWLPVEIVRAEEARLEANANKYLPTEEDLHPDRRFVDSQLVDIISRHPQLQGYIADKGINWGEEISLIPRLAEMVISSEPYKAFMSAPGAKTIDEEAELWRTLLKQIIFPSEDLAEALENKSIFWNDDLEVMSSFALKTLRRLAANPEEPLQPEFKDEEDENFGAQLFDLAVANGDEYRALIDEFINTKKWDADRVALMDTVILETALAEAIGFPNIPLTVTANEYVEIANWYSTSRSGAFVNGMLASITEKLRKEGRIAKKFN
ncbi:MAG: hypothetical protein OSJ24_01850 [Muribaculaceae bacterium]|nr:hypothetical protein [Muribaculaceae bacterium]